MGRNSSDFWAQDREEFIGKEEKEGSHQESASTVSTPLLGTIVHFCLW